MAVGLLSAANWPIVGQICWVLGKVMNFIYTMLDDVLASDTGLVGLSIIIYTILVYTCMLPMTINQQRTSKLQAVINPEVQAIQKKYRNKKDQASQLKMQEEMQQVYDKYGTSMMSGCLPLLIQMPFLFALYPVIYRIQDYVPNITEEANKFLTIPNMTISPSAMLSAVRHGEDLGVSSVAIIITVIALPVISGATQYLSIRLSQAISNQNMDKDNPMAGTMKTMNMTMPLMSVFMVFTLPTGIGVYWIISAVVRCVQQVFINKHLSKMSVEDLIEKNKDKAEKKRKKRSENAERINAMAQTNTKSIKSSANRSVSAKNEKVKEEKIARAQANIKEGSLASKANMVKKFNENK
ncbi:YidC/Oxa1 family membrane protein insertase [Faecalicatena contorta]|uniref:YidC/Oxa1 family membrane protein insertase n=1 Tax=Faecalicatena contorta TaxID=39482 RepID=UPI001F472277|nr:YidC/Oxa1 family membrane protein insertase [Faecalicatena contorta]MCF2555675.1 YidC/Oxa1 family membrane protein insertase [Faecalicatena contorta]MCF2680511.1 YidC/Oxa1 family membrane protein insertase [Faecalicatena contorta]